MPAVFDYYPFDRGAGANSTETRWRNMMNGMKSTGIIAQGASMAIEGGDCAVSGGTGMSITIDTGKAWIRGHMFEHSGSSTSLAISPNDSATTRTDLVVIRADFIENIIQYQVLEGSPLPIQSSTVWDLPLAKIDVPSGATSSDHFMITDQRVFATPNALVPSIKRFQDTAQSIPNNKYTSLSLNNGIYWQTQDSMYLGADPTKISIQQDGFYFFYGRVTIPGDGTFNAAHRRGVRVLANGSEMIAVNQVIAGTGAQDISCASIWRCLAGDYVQLQAYQDSGAAINTLYCEMVVHYLGIAFME